MEALKYTVIKSVEQYKEYCNNLEKLLENDNEAAADEIDLLTLLIEKWDEENTSLNQLTPIELLKSLMEENNLKAVDLVNILELSKGTVSKILNYQKGLSKETIRKLSEYFNMNQEAFNRPYNINESIKQQSKNRRVHAYKVVENKVHRPLKKVPTGKIKLGYNRTMKAPNPALFKPAKTK